MSARNTKEDPRTGTGADGVRRFIETDEHGRAWITTAATDEHGNPNPPVNAENIRRLLPKVAAHFHAQGAARRPAKAATGDEAKAAATGERERVRQILQHPYAKGREALAQQLALTPEMSVEKAGELLAVAPIEQPYTDGVLASEPNDEAREAADHAVRAARDGGFIR